MRCGAFVDVNRIKQYTEDDFLLPETPPFNWLLRKTKDDVTVENKTDDEKLSISQNDENASPNNNNNLASKHVIEPVKLSQSPKAGPAENIIGTSPSSLKSQSRWSIRENREDDKLTKELVSLRNNFLPLNMFSDLKIFSISALSIRKCIANW